MFPSRRTLVSLLAILVISATGCRNDLVSPAPNESLPGEVGIRYPVGPRVNVLGGELASLFVGGYARALAGTGRRDLQNYLATSATGMPFESLLEYREESTPPAVSAEIVSKNTEVEAGGAEVSVVSSMTARSDYGLHTITVQMIRIGNGMGYHVADFPAVQDFRSNPNFWSLLPWTMQTVVSSEAPQGCGLRAEASTAHEAWWAPVPAPRLPLSMMPEWTRVGRTVASSSDLIDQPSCSGDGSGGGGDDNGGGQLMGHYVCYSRDWYDGDGNYLYTVFEGCYLQYTYWLAE